MTLFFFFSLWLGFCWFSEAHMLIGSHILLVKCNHLHAAAMTGCARNCFWHLLTSALGDIATRLLPAFGPCFIDIFYEILLFRPARRQPSTAIVIFTAWKEETYAFSALTLLVGRQEEHPAWVMRCWCGCLSGARCRLLAYGPADATASRNPTISCLI